LIYLFYLIIFNLAKCNLANCNLAKCHIFLIRHMLSKKLAKCNLAKCPTPGLGSRINNFSKWISKITFKLIIHQNLNALKSIFFFFFFFFFFFSLLLRNFPWELQLWMFYQQWLSNPTVYNADTIICHKCEIPSKYWCTKLMKEEEIV